MNPATSVTLQDNLQNLKLTHMAKELESSLRQARDCGHDYGEFLLQLTEHELRIRSENRLKRRIREAKFPLLKTMEEFDYALAPELDKRLIRQLCTGDYIKEPKNVIFLGKSGTGKTHMATALGVEACRLPVRCTQTGQGVRTRFISACGLANELIEARQEKDLQRILKRYAGYGLLILDELGYIPFSVHPLNAYLVISSLFYFTCQSTNKGDNLSPLAAALGVGPRYHTELSSKTCQK